MSKTDRDLTVYEFERRVNVSKKYKQSLQNDGQELNRSQSQNDNDLIETKKKLLIQEKIYTQDQNLNKLVDYVKYDQIRFDDQEKRYQKYEKNYDQSDQQQQDNQYLQYQEKQKISSQKYYDQNDKQFYQDENLKKFTQQIQEKQIQSKENQLGVVKQKQNILNYDNNQHIIQIQNNQEKFDRFVKKNDHSQKQDLQSQIDKNNDLLFQNEKENYYNFKDRNQNSKYQSREKSNQQDLQILSSNLNSKNNYLNEQQYKKDIENQDTQLQQSNKFLHSHEQKNQKLNVQNLSKNFAQIMSKQGLTEQIQQKSLDSSIMGSIIINDNDLKTGSKIESQQEFEKYFQIYIQSSIMDIDYIITKLSAFNQFQDMCKEIKLKRFSKIQFLEKFFLFMQKIIKSFKATCETSKTVNGQVSAQYLKVKGQDQSIMTQVHIPQNVKEKYVVYLEDDKTVQQSNKVKESIEIIKNKELKDAYVKIKEMQDKIKENLNVENQQRLELINLQGDNLQLSKQIEQLNQQLKNINEEKISSSMSNEKFDIYCNQLKAKNSYLEIKLNEEQLKFSELERELREFNSIDQDYNKSDRQQFKIYQQNKELFQLFQIEQKLFEIYKEEQDEFSEYKKEKLEFQKFKEKQTQLEEFYKLENEFNIFKQEKDNFEQYLAVKNNQTSEQLDELLEIDTNNSEYEKNKQMINSKQSMKESIKQENLFMQQSNEQLKKFNIIIDDLKNDNVQLIQYCSKLQEQIKQLQSVKQEVFVEKIIDFYKDKICILYDSLISPKNKEKNSITLRQLDCKELNESLDLEKFEQIQEDLEMLKQIHERIFKPKLVDSNFLVVNKNEEVYYSFGKSLELLDDKDSKDPKTQKIPKYQINVN